MMIPMVWFLVAWLVLLAIFALVMLLTVTVYLRYGLTAFSTYLTTVVFLGVIAVVIFSTAAYLLGVDWSRTLDVFANGPPTLGL